MSFPPPGSEGHDVLSTRPGIDDRTCRAPSAVEPGTRTPATGHRQAEKLRGSAANHRALGRSRHKPSASDRAEVSHESTRQRERAMRWFRSMAPARRFFSVHGTTQNLFGVGRRLLREANYRVRGFVPSSVERGDLWATRPEVSRRWAASRSADRRREVVRSDPDNNCSTTASPPNSVLRQQSTNPLSQRG